MGPRSLLFSALLALPLALASCEKKEGETAPTPPPMELAVAEVIQKDIPVFAEFVGTLDGNVNADIRARVPGILQSQTYQEGTVVKTGQVLFTIDARAYQASALQAQGELGKAKAALAKAEADVARYKPLVEKNAISKQELDNAIASKDAAIASVQAMTGALENTNINLGYTKVTSPVDGVAGIAKVRIGNLVGQGEPTLLTTVSNLDPIRVVFSISEQQYMAHVEKLRKAQAEGRDAGPRPGLELILADGSVHPTRGKVALADRQVETSTGTIALQAFFPNPGNALRPGQYGKVRATTDQRLGAILVPQRAVQELQDRRQVFVVDASNKIDAREVTAGERVGSFWVIDSGLKAGERVVVEGVQKAKVGMTIVPKAITLDLSSLTPSKEVAPPSAPSAAPGASAAAAAPANPTPRSEATMGAFFIRRPVMAMVLSILIVLAGVVAMGRLPIAQFPNIVPPEILVSTVYTGADAVTIEQAVATPIEQQINGVDNMIYVKSTNANDGTMSIRVNFGVGTDIDMDNVLTQNRVSQANATLPADVKNYGVTIKKSLGMPMVLFSLYSPNGTYDAQFLGNYATININDALARIPGVGQITNFGTADYAMRVWVKPDRLAKLGLTVGDLRNAIQRQNTVNPAGQIGAEPAPKGQEFTYTVRAQGRLVTADQFGDVVVRENPDGSLVRLRDVSRIELGAATYTQRGRYNGKAAAIIGVYQSPGSNALEVSKQTRAVVEELSKKFPDGLEYKVSLDTTLAVTAGIEEIIHTLGEAMFLVILVVFLFLQSWRATLIPMLTVPVSLIGAFLFFPMLGFSINTLSLFGLVLAIGLVVDDAIVVVEAVEHHIAHGLSPEAATQKAMAEVSGPVVAIALILAAVFVPCAFMSGLTGSLYKQFAVTIALSVIISAFNALSLSPALCSLLLKPRKESKGPLAKFFAWFNRVFDRMTEGYVSWTRILVRKWIRGVLILAILSAGVFVVGKRLPAGFIPDEDQGYLFVNVQLPDAASLQRTDEVCTKVEKILAETPGVEAYNTIAGFSLVSQTSATYSGFFFVSLKPWEERHAKAESFQGIMQALNKRFAALPEGQVIAFLPPAIPGIGTSAGFTLQLQDRAGGTVEDLEAQGMAFVQAVRKRPEIGSIYTMFRPAVPQVYAKVDREKVLKQGMDLQDVYGTLQAFMGGSYINDFNRFGRQWKVYLGAEPEYRVRSEEIDNFFVRNGTGNMVPLSSVVTVERTRGPEFTNRFNLMRSAEFNGSPAPGYSSGQAMDALEEVAKATLSKDFGYAWSGMSYQQRTAPGSAGVFLLSLLFVFLILAAQYESWSLPFSVLLGTPICVLGAFLGLFVQKMDLDVYGQIGLIMLIGLAAKNSILIVEFARSELHAGKPLEEAALNGARLRLRPILMTSFAFILGCVPLLRATGAGAVSRQVLGTVVVFGMVAATAIGIFLTPALFTLIERMTGRKTKHEVPPAPVVTPEHAPEAS